MSWKPEVEVNGQWSRNALVFATEEEAETFARELFDCWMLITGYRAVEVDEPINYALIDGQLVAVKEAVHG